MVDLSGQIDLLFRSDVIDGAFRNAHIYTSKGQVLN